MQGELWLNLPVRDVARTREFFEKIGFHRKTGHDTAEMACFEFDERKTEVLFLAEEKFREYSRCEIADAGRAAELMISIGAESRDEVDETARKVFDAGGTIFAAPAEIMGWMYGFGFQDPDGHRWNLLFRDFAKLNG